MPQNKDAEALQRATVRADMAVARLKVAARLRAALGRRGGRVEEDRLRSAELHARRLHEARNLLAVSGLRRRTTAP